MPRKSGIELRGPILVAPDSNAQGRVGGGPHEDDWHCRNRANRRGFGGDLTTARGVAAFWPGHGHAEFFAWIDEDLGWHGCHWRMHEEEQGEPLVTWFSRTSGRPRTR
jgi:hypothetical protein